MLGLGLVLAQSEDNVEVGKGSLYETIPSPRPSLPSTSPNADGENVVILV